MKDRADKIPGEKVRIEKEFAWDGRTWRIPAVYICEEGVVADFCIRIPSEEIESFLKVRAEQKNPFSVDAQKEVWMNGKKAGGWNGCSTFWIPAHLRDESEAQSVSDGIEGKILEAYECDCRDGWCFKRMSVSWPEGVQPPVHSLTFRLKKAPIYYPGLHFRTDFEEGKKQIEFLHPVTGTEHRLTVQALEQIVLSESDLSGIRSKGQKIRKLPTHFLTIYYTVEPEVPLQELRIADCAESDPPETERRTGKASVSVIGGKDGPVAVFFAGKVKTENERKDWKKACSSLHYEPVRAVEWRMEFWVESKERAEISILL